MSKGRRGKKRHRGRSSRPAPPRGTAATEPRDAPSEGSEDAPLESRPAVADRDEAPRSLEVAPAPAAKPEPEPGGEPIVDPDSLLPRPGAGSDRGALYFLGAVGLLILAAIAAQLIRG